MIVEVVCHANICRSPVAAAFLERAAGFQVRSSGLLATPGLPADARMREWLGDKLPSLHLHRSTRFGPQRLPTADLILVMERDQRLRVINLVPHMAGRTMLFGQWLAGEQDITDPHGLSDEKYTIAIERLRDAAVTWIERLARMS